MQQCFNAGGLGILVSLTVPRTKSPSQGVSSLFPSGLYFPKRLCIYVEQLPPGSWQCRGAGWAPLLTASGLLGDLMLIAHLWDTKTKAAKASGLNKPPRYHSGWKTTLSAFQSCQSAQQLRKDLSVTRLPSLRPSLCKWPTTEL